jgi:hypothetical protein
MVLLACIMMLCLRLFLQRKSSPRGRVLLPPGFMQLTMLQKMVQQSGTISDGILTPLDSLRSSATPSATAASSLAAVDRRSDNAPHLGLTRAADCFRCAAGIQGC